MPTDGYLEGNLNPTEEDWRAAFPSEPVDWAALSSPPGVTPARQGCGRHDLGAGMVGESVWQSGQPGILAIRDT